MATAASLNLRLRLVWLFPTVIFAQILSGTSLAVASQDKQAGTAGTTSEAAVSEAARDAMGTPELVFRHRSLLSSSTPQPLPLPVDALTSLPTSTSLLSSSTPQLLPVDPLNSLQTPTSFGGNDDGVGGDDGVDGIWAQLASWLHSLEGAASAAAKQGSGFSLGSMLEHGMVLPWDLHLAKRFYGQVWEGVDRYGPGVGRDGQMWLGTEGWEDGMGGSKEKGSAHAMFSLGFMRDLHLAKRFYDQVWAGMDRPVGFVTFPQADRPGHGGSIEDALRDDTNAYIASLLALLLAVLFLCSPLPSLFNRLPLSPFSPFPFPLPYPPSHLLPSMSSFPSSPPLQSLQSKALDVLPEIGPATAGPLKAALRDDTNVYIASLLALLLAVLFLRSQRRQKRVVQALLEGELECVIEAYSAFLLCCDDIERVRLLQL
ncbi:unnamed protein product [Closterium sp. Naga37s-1]|nr:unnamed protein product [Closterium sp. Naga37s-1]